MYSTLYERHWSLYDAMFYSNYVASKLEVWKTQGTAKLKVFSVFFYLHGDLNEVENGVDALVRFLG